MLDCLLVLAQRESLFRVVERVVYADSRLGLFLTVDEGVMKAKKDAMGDTYADMVVVEFKGLLLFYLSKHATRDVNQQSEIFPRRAI